MPHTDHPQLTLTIDLHSDLDPETAILWGTLKLKGDFRIDRDLNAGDELTVTVATADGEVITGGRMKCSYPHPKEITDKGRVIGTERVHTAELVEAS